MAYLLARGIPAGLAEEALRDYDESRGARKLYEKKLRSTGGLAPETRKRRVFGALSRKGHSARTIRGILKENKEDEYE